MTLHCYMKYYSTILICILKCIFPTTFEHFSLFPPGLGGGGRSAIQMALGIDIVTAGGGGSGAYCLKKKGCGGGGKSEFVFLLCSIVQNDFSQKFNDFKKMVILLGELTFIVSQLIQDYIECW